MMLNALEKMNIGLTIKVTFSGPLAKKAPIICKKGAPAMYPTCNYAGAAIYSFEYL